MNNAPKKTPPAVRPPPATIPCRFAQVVSRFPNRVAVSTPNTQWTYSELDDYSDVLACEIIDRVGVVSSPAQAMAGEPVALLMEHAAPLIAAILGVLKAGKIYLALDPTDLAAHLTAMLGHAHAKLLLTDKANASLAHSLASGLLQVMEIDDHFAIRSESTISAEVPSEVGAWLMYTSGSTGTPKGVWQNHCNVVHHTDVYSDMIKLTPDDCLSLLTSCSLAASATHLFAALLNGATLCPFHVRSQGVERLADWLRRQQVSVYHSVPTVFRHLMRSVGDNRYFESLRLIRLGGEPVLRSDVEAYRRHCPANCILMHALSSTETGLISALMINQQAALPDGRVSVGHTVRGVEVLLIDERGQLVSPGSDGRIAVRSAHLAQGYWLHTDETAKAFHKDAHNPQARVFITGDLGRLQPDGCLEHLGRFDHQVKIQGRRVDLSEVETALQATNLFEEAVASAQEYPSGGDRLVAHVVPRAATVEASEGYRHLLKRSLPDYMIPVDFVPMVRLPKTTGGKVDRLALPPPPRRSESLVSHRPMPRDRFEKVLASIWESALGVSNIGRCDDFFDLGGTSLASIEVLAQIEKTLNVALSPSIIAEHSTIEKLAALIADRVVGSSPNPLVMLRAAASGRPLFLVHGGPGNVAMYGELSRRLPDRPIYGLQAIGLRGESWPLTSFPGMARRYIREVMAADPTGPYMLAGRCLGGLIAFEMAQQLVRRGRSVGLVALIDSPYPVPTRRRLRWTERAVMNPFHDMSRILRWGIASAIGLRRNVDRLPAYRRFVAQMIARARRAYKPVFYPGTITLVLADNAHFDGEDPRLMMARYARQTHTINIRGNFGELLIPPAVNELARQLQASLDAAQSGDAP